MMMIVELDSRRRYCYAGVLLFGCCCCCCCCCCFVVVVVVVVWYSQFGNYENHDDTCLVAQQMRR